MIVSKELTLPGVFHGFFTRNGGVSNGIYNSLNAGLGSDDERQDVLKNRELIATKAGVAPDFLLSPHQVHSPDVINVTAPWEDETDRRADALVTNSPDIAIGVLTADCGPVLFADPKAGVVGAAHSGWRGAVTGVLENTVKAMETLGATRANITAVLGPTISQDAYEVGAEFRDRFLQEDQTNERFFRTGERPEHFQFDLPAFILNTLGRLDIDSANWTGNCTYGEEDTFFSYRRSTHRSEPDYGRQISVIRFTGANP